MSKPIIHGKGPTLTASLIRAAIAQDLSQIKAEDGLTFADIGRILGKSEDQAAKYCDGTACMDAVTFQFARKEWNGRFTGSVDALVAGARRNKTNDRCKATAICRANMALSVALEDDDEVSPAEARQMRRDLEAAREALDELLRRLTVRAA